MKEATWHFRIRLVKLIVVCIGLFWAFYGTTVGGRLFYHWMMTADEFSVTEINVYDNDLAPTEEIVALTGLSPGVNIFQTDLPSAKERLKQDPRFEDAFLRRSWPNKIQVHVVERRPIAFIQFDRLYGVDADGVLIPLPVSDRLPDLPVITGCQKTQFIGVDRGETMDGRLPGLYSGHQSSNMLQRAIYVLEQVETHTPEFSKRISEVHVENPDDPILYTMKDGMTIRLGVGRYPAKLQRLQAMFKRLKRDSIPTSSIDLRFKDQVIIRPIASGTNNKSKS